MIPRLWTCKELALIAAIVALACVAAFLSIKLTRPKPFASASFGAESQCKQSPSTRLRNDTNCPDLADL